tara:strand:- start:8609 stop:8773 length:165 start_codon:yes stop_codon:yes gene_type:complete
MKYKSNVTMKYKQIDKQQAKLYPKMSTKETRITADELRKRRAVFYNWKEQEIHE